MKSHSKKKKFFFGLLAVLAGLLLALALLEGYVRWTRQNVDLYVLTGRRVGPSPISGWAVPDSFSSYRARPGRYANGKTVNPHGFVSTPELEVQKSPDTIRIVFLGESSTAGMGWDIKDEETWPWLAIERIREQASSPVEFINGALGAYTSFESFGRLWSRIRFFSPDIVIICHGWNEMYYFEHANAILSWRTLSDNWSIHKARKPITVYAPLGIDPWIRWSQFLSRLRLRLSRTLGGETGSYRDTPLVSDFDRNGLSIWRTNLKLLRETCAVLNTKIFVVKQPTLIVPDLPPEERERCRYDFHGFDHEAHLIAFAEIYRIIDEEIPADSIIDLTPLSGRPEYFFDHIHPTPLGCREIAKIVSEALRPCIEKMVSAGESK